MLKGTDIAMLGTIPKNMFLKGVSELSRGKLLGSMGISLPLRSVSN